MLLDTFSSTLFFSLFPALSFSFSALDAGRVCSVSSCIALLGSRNILRPFAATKCRRHYLLSSLPSSFFFFFFFFFFLSFCSSFASSSSSSSSTSTSTTTHAVFPSSSYLVGLYESRTVLKEVAPFNRACSRGTCFPLSPGIAFVSQLLRGPNVSLHVSSNLENFSLAI